MHFFHSPKNKKIIKFIYKYFIILSGALLFSVAVNLFMIPAKIVTGGVSGIATIIYYVFGISPGIVMGILNIIIGIVAYIELGKKFVVDSLVGIIAIPVFMELTKNFELRFDDLVLSSVFGGIICGIGIGMTFSQGSTTGGTDIVSRISQKRLPSLSIGVILSAIDFLIISVSYFVFKDIKLTMYGMATLFISSWVIDFIIAKLNGAVVAYIITSKDNGLKNDIINKISRGITVIDARGGYSSDNKEILMCAMKKKELIELRKIAEGDEYKAFIIVSPSTEVQGEGFKYYR